MPAIPQEVPLLQVVTVEEVTWIRCIGGVVVREAVATIASVDQGKDIHLSLINLNLILFHLVDLFNCPNGRRIAKLLIKWLFAWEMYPRINRSMPKSAKHQDIVRLPTTQTTHAQAKFGWRLKARSLDLSMSSTTNDRSITNRSLTKASHSTTNITITTNA